MKNEKWKMRRWKYTCWERVTPMGGASYSNGWSELLQGLEQNAPPPPWKKSNRSHRGSVPACARTFFIENHSHLFVLHLLFAH